MSLTTNPITFYTLPANNRLNMDEDKEKAIEAEDTSDVYSEEGRDSLEENEEIETWEEGFMEGADMDGQKAKCANCGKIVINENAVEKEIDGEDLFFCSEKCVEKYEKKHGVKEEGEED